MILLLNLFFAYSWQINGYFGEKVIGLLFQECVHARVCYVTDIVDTRKYSQWKKSSNITAIIPFLFMHHYRDSTIGTHKIDNTFR